MKFWIIFFIALLTVFSFFLVLNSGATEELPALPPEEEEEEECIPSVSTWTEEEYDRDEFMCQSESCGTDILKRERWREYSCWDDGCGDSDCTFSGYIYINPTTFQTLDSWQKCDPYQSTWKPTIPSYECKGNCLGTPENPRYYDNPTYSDQLDKNYGNKNIYLPVKLDWDDVEGWKTEKGPQSYEITMENATPTDPLTNVIQASEFIPLSCNLKSEATHNWQVKACCTIDGQDCGSESEGWNFSTNAAPEPISPLDPDWQGEEAKEDEPYEMKLEWCEIEMEDGEEKKPPSIFELLFYQIENEEEKCHPEQERATGCEEKILYPEPAAGILFPPSEFSNQKYDYFTKGTTYAWEVAACQDISRTNCTDYSQKWRFTVGEFVVTEPGLFGPPNDPQGKDPVGLPVTLRWTGEPGAKSYRYKISDFPEKVTASINVTLDSPQLSLNSFYNWQIKSCSDYLGENCEENWSELFYFKTTGQAPNLVSPQGSNISIPTKFEWQEIGGAKSYIFEVSGPGPRLTTTIETTSLTLDYPDLKQETQYNWQVKTCVRTEGQLCGNWQRSSFQTFKIPAPAAPKTPEDNSIIFTYQMPKTFSWQLSPGAKYYKYVINYSVKVVEESSQCPTGKTIDKIAPNPSALVSLNCLGEYSWQVSGCLDKDCQQQGFFSESWRFSLAEGEKKDEGGLVPCGRETDDPDTNWINERDSCQMKHLFVLFKNVLDFLLWTIGPIILVLLVLASGAMFYLSLRFQTPMTKVKSLWEAAGIGYGIIFFAWTIINIFLNIVGYNVGIFGQWWIITF